MIRILFFECLQKLRIDLLRHRAPRPAVGEDDMLLGCEDLNRLCHKPHTAHQDLLLPGLGCLHAQTVGIPDIIRHLEDIMRLIGMRKDAYVVFFFKADDLVLYLSDCSHTISLPADVLIKNDRLTLVSFYDVGVKSLCPQLDTRSTHIFMCNVLLKHSQFSWILKNPLHCSCFAGPNVMFCHASMSKMTV